MVGASRVSAYAETANDLSILVVQRKSSAENNDASDWFSDERVIGLTELLRIAGESGIWIRTTHDAVKRIAGLSSGIDVAAGKSEVVSAEGICRIRFLGGDQTAAWPLRASIRAGKYDGANYSVAVHYCSPLLISESAVRALALFDSAGQRGFELVVVRNLRTILRVLRKGKR